MCISVYISYGNTYISCDYKEKRFEDSTQNHIGIGYIEFLISGFVISGLVRGGYTVLLVMWLVSVNVIVMVSVPGYVGSVWQFSEFAAEWG